MDWNKVDKTLNTAGKVYDGAARVGRALLGGFFILIGIGMLIWCGLWFSDRISNLDNYVLTNGTVIEFEKSKDPEGSGYSYSPNVSFKDRQGVEHIYNSSNASDPPAYDIGEKVEIYYNSNDPEDAFINSFLEKWVIGIVLGIVGIVMVPIGVWLIISAFKLTNRTISQYDHYPSNQNTGVRIG